MSDLDLAQHTGLAILLAQHTNEAASQEASKIHTIVIRNAAPKESSKKAAKPSKGEQAAPIHNKPAVFGVVMPEKGTLTAKDFLIAMRNAGSRVDANGKRWTDPKEVRNDQIQAIQSYIGYDIRQSFGSQDNAARMQAGRELSGKPIVVGPTREEVRSAERSLSGYVHGMPDHTQRTLADLTGREQAALEAAIDHDKVARDPASSASERLAAAGLAAVERERAASIRRDIAAMRF